MTETRMYWAAESDDVCALEATRQARDKEIRDALLKDAAWFKYLRDSATFERGAELPALPPDFPEKPNRAESDMMRICHDRVTAIRSGSSQYDLVATLRMINDNIASLKGRADSISRQYYDAARSPRSTGRHVQIPFPDWVD